MAKDYSIYALKGDPDGFDFLSWLKRGEGRFGWSYIESADLFKLKNKIETFGWEALSPDEKSCYQSFLLDIKDGDYVVYINVPEWGLCTTAQVTGPYRWAFDGPDFNHRFDVNPNSVFSFNRNDHRIHPALRARLRLQGRWWRIYLPDEFLDLLESINDSNVVITESPATNLKFLSNEIQPFLLDITRRIHHTHPNYDLEKLVAEVFKNVPGVVDVKCQGGAYDHGADILVTYNSGLPIPGLESQELLVIQVKSYDGTHSDLSAIEDIRRAFDYYQDARIGLIVSTANNVSSEFEEALSRLAERGKPVAILVGQDVAAFLLRYGAELLA